MEDSEVTCISSDTCSKRLVERDYMSLPMPPPGVAAMPLLHPVDALLASVNSNPYFIGSMMLMLNLGGRFIALELSRAQETFFQNVWVRRLLIFTVIFVGTRNVAVAFWMSIFVILVLGYLLNENSDLCVYTGSSTCKRKSGFVGGVSANATMMPSMHSMPSQQGGVQGLSPEESAIFRSLSEKVQRTTTTAISQSQNAEDAEDARNATNTANADKKKMEDESLVQNYMQNMMMLRNDGVFNPRF